jgi:hypothetical protein
MRILLGMALVCFASAFEVPVAAPMPTVSAQLLVVAAGGGAVRVLSSTPALALSPDRARALVTVRTADSGDALAVRVLVSGAEQIVFVAPPEHLPSGSHDPAQRFGEAVWPTAETIVFDWIDDSPCTPPGTGCVVARLEKVAPDGTGLVRLADSARFPAFSTDASRWVALAPFEFYDSIGTVTATTGGVTRAYGWSGLPPALAPSGDAVAWIGSADASVVVGLPRLRVAGGARASLPITLVGQDPTATSVTLQPLAWSPDGRTLAFVRSNPGWLQLDATGWRSSLCIADQTLRRIRCRYSAGAIDRPLWSPDGSRIAIRASSFRKHGRRILLTDRLVVVPVAPGHRAIVVAVADPRDDGQAEIQPLAWSRDGRRVYFDGAAHAPH